MIISVHIPRTAGTSFRRLLEEHFQDGLLHDYGNPILVRSSIRNGYALAAQCMNGMKASSLRRYQCIHGHFLPVKYNGLLSCDNQFVIWVRDPLERIISHYQFSIQHGDSVHNKSPFQTKVFKEKWSFERFSLSPEMQNVMSRFLWRFPLDYFSFIGDVRQMQSDMDFFCKHFLHAEGPQLLHVNDTQKAVIADDLSDDDIAKIRECHSHDYDMYQAALTRREKLMSLAI